MKPQLKHVETAGFHSVGDWRITGGFQLPRLHIRSGDGSSNGLKWLGAFVISVDPTLEAFLKNAKKESETV